MQQCRSPQESKQFTYPSHVMGACELLLLFRQLFVYRATR
jgi:hypothetical protein